MFKKSYLFLFVLLILFLSFGIAFAIDLTLETGKSESINFENYFIYNSDKSITFNIAEGDNVISVTNPSYTNTIRIEAKRSGTAKLYVGVHSSNYVGLDRDGNPVWIYQNTIYTYNITVKDNTPKTTNFEIRYNNQTVTGQKIKVDLTEKNVITLTGVPMPSNAKPALSWSSQNTDIATVNSGRVTGWENGTARITATTNDGSRISRYVDIEFTSPAVSGINITYNGTTVTGQTLTINQNNNTRTYQFSVSVNPANAYQNAVWSSSDTSLATVDRSGLVTLNNGRKAGTVTITAAAVDGSGKSAWVKITAPAAQSVNIKNNGTVVNGKTLTINQNSTVKTIQLTGSVSPETAYQEVTWSSSKPEIASVNSNGLVTGLKIGTARITATAKDGSGKSAWVDVTIPAVQSISIKNNGSDVTGKTINVNWNTTKTIQLSASASPTNALQQFTWSSGNTNAATVDSKGLVSLLKSGTARITVKATDGSGKSAWVDVVIPAVQSISIKNNGVDVTGKTVVMNVNLETNTLQLSASANPAEALQQFTWSSGNTAIATVNSSGLVSRTWDPTITGTARITVKANDGSGKSAWVDIQLPAVQSIKIFDGYGNEVNGKTINMDLNESDFMEFKTVSYPEEAENLIKLESNNDDVVYAISNSITSKGFGDAKITARAAYGSSATASFNVHVASKTKFIKIRPSSTDYTVNLTGRNITLSPNSSYDICIDSTPASESRNIDLKNSNSTVIGIEKKSYYSDCYEITAKQVGNARLTATVIDESNISEFIDITVADSDNTVPFYSVNGSTIVIRDGTERFNCGRFSNESYTKIFIPESVYQVDGPVYVLENKIIQAYEGSYAETWADRWGLQIELLARSNPLTTKLQILDSKGNDITGKTVNLNPKEDFFDLYCKISPSTARDNVSWASNNTDLSTIRKDLIRTNAFVKHAYWKTGTVKITVSANDGSGKSAWVILNYDYHTPLASLINIRNSSGSDITFRTITVSLPDYQLKGEVDPEDASQQLTWKSSDTNIAAVDSTGKVTFKKNGTVTITAIAMDGSEKSSWVKLTYASPIPLAISVAVQNSSGTVVTGKTITVNSATYQLKAVASPAGAAQNFNWSSNNTGIATVDANGKVTFKTGGTVTITATAADGSKKSAWVKLNYNKVAPTSIKIKTAEGTDITGKQLLLTKCGLQLNAEVLPSEADQTVKWYVDSNGYLKKQNQYISITDNGFVSQVGDPGYWLLPVYVVTGDYGITNEVYSWMRVQIVMAVNQIKIKQNGIDYTGKSLTVNNQTVQFSAEMHGKDGASFEAAWIKQLLTWKSSNTGIAEVDANGKLTFKKAGTVRLDAIANDCSGKTVSVNVTYVPLETSVKIVNASNHSENLTGKTIVTYRDYYYNLCAEAMPSNALQNFTWSSSNTDIATVSPFGDTEGWVDFKKPGTVTITATTTDGSGKSAWVKLTYVEDAPVREIKDSNIRGKNKEIQIVIPWSSDLMKVECTLYNDQTGQTVNMPMKERMDSTGKNKVVSYVGSPLENGTVYRFKVRVYNGYWSNYVEKYAMPIANVFGATVVAGNKTMVINNQHREPTTGARYMLCDADTEKEIAYRVGTRTNTTWTYSQLTNGKLYYVVAVPYRDYKGQRLWGPNQMRIYFLPMGIPGNGKVSFTNNTTAEISIGNDSAVDGIRVLYRMIGGKLMNGCEGAGNKCRISGLNKNTAYEFYAMKYKMAQGKKYYSMGTLIPYKTALSGLKAPQNNPVVTMTNSGYTTFSIKKAAEADGISVLYREGEGAFQQACEKAGNSCSTTLSTTKNYTFYIMQYKVVSGKKLYSNGIVARDFSSGKSADTERLYTNFYLADESISQEEIAAALDDYLTEDAMLMAEAMEAMSEELMTKSAEEYEFIEDDDSWIEEYARFDSDVMAEMIEKQAVPEPQPETEKGPFSWLNFFFLGEDNNNREAPVPSFENK